MTARLVLGVDPGLDGALALITADGALVDIVDMPTLADGPAGRRTINARLVAHAIENWHPDRAFCELVGPRPGEGAVGAFGFGRSRGILEGVLGAMAVPVEMLAPAWWKRRAGIAPGPDRKDEARSKAIARWPAMADRFARKKDHGRAEACLIAMTGLMREAAGR